MVSSRFVLITVPQSYHNPPNKYLGDIGAIQPAEEQYSEVTYRKFQAACMLRRNDKEQNSSTKTRLSVDAFLKFHLLVEIVSTLFLAFLYICIIILLY